MEASVKWTEGMAFDAQLDGFNFMIDADPMFGGQNKGPKPKGLTLVSLAGCTAMDVVSILGKMRVKPDSFEVATEGALSGEHPKTFTNIVIKYIFTGSDLPLDKLQHAIQLSYETYCGVSAMLKQVAKMSYKVIVNGEEIPV